MRKPALMAMIGLVASGVTAPHAIAQPVFTADWEAASGVTPDQVCPAWTLNDAASPEDPVLASGQLTLATSADAENMSYVQTAPLITMPASLVIETRVRCVSGGSSAPNRGPIAIGFTTAPNVGGFLYIDADFIFLTAAGDVQGPSAVVDTDNTAHTFRIEVSGTASGSAIAVYYDDGPTPTLTGATYTDAASLSGTERIIWGEVSSLAHGSQEWAFLRHNAAACPSTTTTTTVTTESTVTSTTAPTSPTCGGLPDGPTFSSIRCRITALVERVVAESGLGTFQTKLTKTLGKAQQRTADAQTVCGDGNAKKGKKRLQQANKALTQYAHRLAGLAARKKLDQTLRTDLIAAGAAIAPDVTTLRAQLACPGDASE